jgi:hypothetical protein
MNSLFGRSIRPPGSGRVKRFWGIFFVAKDTIFSAGKKLEFSEILIGIVQIVEKLC